MSLITELYVQNKRLLETFLQFCSSSLQLLATWRSWVKFHLYKVIIVTHITPKALTTLNPKFMKVNSKLERT